MNSILNKLLNPKLINNRISQRYLRGGLERKDPGIRKRAAILQQNLQIEDNADDLLDLEADFFDLSKSHKQHEREMEASRELQKYHIVRQKYFKEKLPNFLTWADKQQIKYLHSSNPAEWTVERLAEGFPALPDTIQKIIKATWVPKNVNRVKRHDENVQENWHKFKTQKQVLKLPQEVIAHLHKFSSRELNLNPNLSEFQVPDVSKRELVKKGGEFSMIIESYQGLNAKTQELKHSNVETRNILPEKSKSYQESSKLNDTKLNLKNSNKLLTYDELEKQILQKERKNCTEILQLKAKVADNWDDNNTQEETSKEIVLNPKELDSSNMKKFNSGQVNLYKPKRDYSNLMYPERIKIPADKVKRGYTYRLNDCFYDSDGEFLYRVPGMG